MNPFNPTFGDVPKILIDNDPKTTDIYKLVQQSPFARSFFITGVRGSGKTVLLSHLTKMFHILSITSSISINEGECQ